MIYQVSIIIPTFNRSSLLKETLKSVSWQTFVNWECIIVDDGSSDNTAQIVNDISSRDGRFKYFTRPENYPKGASSCRNFGFEKSDAKYIQWLDDDDLLSENKLELQVARLEKLNNSLVFTTCDWDLFWEGKKIALKNVLSGREFLTSQNYFSTLSTDQTFIPIHSFLISRQLILKSGLWNPQLSFNDDAEFIARIIIQSEKLVNTKQCFVLYREYEGDRISRQKDIDKIKSQINSLKLIHQHLKQNNIENKAFFKWKLLLLFHQNWEANKEILYTEYDFLYSNGIDLRISRYYTLKYWLYRKVYPIYKRLFK